MPEYDGGKRFLPCDIPHSAQHDVSTDALPKREAKGSMEVTGSGREESHMLSLPTESTYYWR